MKRKMLEDMGLTKEQVDQIMNANGEDINAAKGELETVKQELETTKTQLQEANTTIDGFKDYEEIKGQVADYKSKYEKAEAEKAQIKLDHEFDGKLASVAKKYGAKALKAVIPYLDTETLKQSKNQDKDIDDAFKALADSEESAFLFGANEPINNPVLGGGGGGGTDSTLAAMRAAAGLPPEK